MSYAFFKDFTNNIPNLQDQVAFKRQLMSEDAKSDALKLETQRMLAQMAEMDKKTAERQNKVNPQTGKSYMQVASDASKGKQEREQAASDSLRKDRPNLAARIDFSSQSIARSASGTGANANSDLDAFNALSPEDQARVAPTQRTGRLTDMQKAQAGRVAASQAKGGNNSLGANVVSGSNAIEKVVDERKSNAMGGAAGAGSFAREWGKDPDSIKTQKSMAVRTPRERLAMIDAQKEEGLRQFREKGKLDKGFVSSVNKFSNSAPAQSETLQKFGQNSRQPMATSEEGRLARDREDNNQLSSATPNVSAKPEEKIKSILSGGDVISRLARMKKNSIKPFSRDPIDVDPS